MKQNGVSVGGRIKIRHYQEHRAASAWFLSPTDIAGHRLGPWLGLGLYGM